MARPRLTVKHPTLADDVAAARARGASWGSIARELGISRASARRLYQNPRGGP